MYQTAALVSLKQIKRNANLIQTRAGCALIAVVKDDGYGHGAAAVAHALDRTAAGFAVASVNEGASLRIAGVTKPVLVLAPPVSAYEAEKTVRYGLTGTVASFASLKLFPAGSEVHLAVNTGMNRYGFLPKQVEQACREGIGLQITGVFSHFYAPEDEEAREAQFRRFRACVKTVKNFAPQAEAHLSATGGILAGQKYNFDAVRCGIGLYGYLPHGFEGAVSVKPAMKIYAPVAQSGVFAGGGVGYQRADKSYKTLSTLRFGYGDGFFREGGFGIGKLCMDACVREGSGKFGAWKLVFSDAARYAKEHGTSAYEALVNVGKGAVKYYV